MCGIIGYCGPRAAGEVLLDGLKRLEYRGYDSAGICVGFDNALTVVKSTGKIAHLRGIVPAALPGTYGIGHTRWATHGVVNDVNAHPHTNQAGDIAIVHNGIIENFSVLKEKLISEGHVFRSQTDSEVIAHLLSDFYEGDLEAALKAVLHLLQGTYGIICVHAQEPNRLVGARNGSPLVLAVGQNEMFLASDVMATLAHTKQVVYLEDGEVVSITNDAYHISELRGDKPISKKVEIISWELENIEKQGHSHFMEKEIFEQPESILRAIQGRLDPENATAHLGGLNMSNTELRDIERVKIVAAGTSFHAGLVASYLMESVAQIPCTAELASELRYRNPIVERNSLYFAVSQSGETIDTLSAMRELKRKGARVLGICNVIGSSIAREAGAGVYIHSGPEIAVASTKAFTSQLAAFYLFTLLISRMHNMSFEAGRGFIQNLSSLPDLVRQGFEQQNHIRALAEKYSHYRDFLFLGRGLNYPVALEGALKLKEISYIHAEGYSAAEIKHGPIALINDETPSIFLVPGDSLREKVISNMKEVKARRGKVIALCVADDEEVKNTADDIITIPKAGEMMYPFLMVVPLQLFAYYTALKLGRDVDQPRNLAKSVTVE
ncbi:MAG: glutamine--fructose-6-phosphate transaminase (isomerizing) [Spirochaetales bacterium]|jgi:glucosamine--fructose-6-phosphate aminotransferase (isomerizing)|nr:glutamine--fructose-6-phosphate transaminase (isomerizing) [Spirochaetales bacterium]